MSDTAVIFNVLARDRASKVFRNISRAASESSSGVAMAFGPAIVPVMATATAGALGFAGALAGAGAAAGVFGIVAGTAFGEIQKGAQKLQATQDLITELGKKAALTTDAKEKKELLEDQADAMETLRVATAMLPPAQRDVTTQYLAMTSSFDKFMEKNQPATYSVMTGGFKAVAAIIPKLQPLFDVGAAAAQRLVGWLNRVTVNGGLDRFVAYLANTAGPALDNLGRIAKNMGITIGAAISSTTPAGQGLLGWLADASEKAANFASGGGFERFMAYVTDQGPGAVALLGNLGQTLGVIYQAVSPLAPVSLAVAGALASIIAALPPPVLTALVSAWIAYTVAMKGYSAAVVATGVATSVWDHKQKILNATMQAGAIVRNTAQLAAYLVKVGAVWVATQSAALAQGVWNGVMIAANWTAQAAAVTYYGVKQAAVAAATKTWAAIQAVMNLALWASPITWVVAGIVGLIAVIVLIATKTTWFQTAWKWAWGQITTHAKRAWGAIKLAGVLFFNWVTGAPGRIRDKWNSAVWNPLRTRGAAAWNYVWGKAKNFYDRVISLPGKVSNKLKGMFAGMWTGFQSAANKVIRGWNGLNFGIPGFSFAGISVPGFNVGTPDIPYLAKGGNIMRAGTAVVGERGPELVHLNRGAQVQPLTGRAAQRVEVVIDVRGSDSELGRLLLKSIRTQPAVKSTMVRLLAN